MDKEMAMSFHCLRWDELPSIPLYMDQVVFVLESGLKPLFAKDEPVVTPTMVNNYVKLKLLGSPEKKKYTREHMAALVVITLLKKVLSMPEIAAVIEAMLKEKEPMEAYNSFCIEVETVLRDAYGNHIIKTVPKSEDVGGMQSAALLAWVGKLLVQDYIQEKDRKME